ncbi:hypothetical protein D3C71_1069880 [compost metagenome]
MAAESAASAMSLSQRVVSRAVKMRARSASAAIKESRRLATLSRDITSFSLGIPPSFPGFQQSRASRTRPVSNGSSGFEIASDKSPSSADAMSRR